MLYLDEKELLNLYNAVNGTNYTDVENLEINTLQNAIYMNMKNDVSFIFNFQVNLYEHQSTVNPNMPLRDLIYVTKLFQNIVRDCDLYGSTLVKIPAPRFVVFYNGMEKQPERKVYRLSDSFSKKQENPELELTVTVLNINAGNNAEILADFLKKNRAEAMEVSIFEYNEEQHLANLRREGYEEGLEQGVQQGVQQGKAMDILELLSELGEVPDALRNIIESKKDIETLSKWLKLAAKSTTIKEFEAAM